MNPPIIVTGPQRSGTTIAAIIKAADHHLDYVDELDFVIGNDYTNSVIQLPNALDSFVVLHHVYPNAFFVVMSRPKEDIIASMKRIQWLRNDVQNWEFFLNDYVEQRLTRCQELLDYLPSQSVLLDYNSLQSHRLFTSSRQNFTSRQWKDGVPRGPAFWDSNVKCIKTYYEQRLTSSAG